MDDNSKTPMQATPRGTLLAQIMDPCQPKNEREWAAKREIERLQDALKKANDQAEHFEREWYLRGDALAVLTAVRDELRNVLRAKDGLLLWALYHHQGGSSPVGQPIRKILGIGQHDHLTPGQIALAKAGALLPDNAELPGAVGIRAE